MSGFVLRALPLRHSLNDALPDWTGHAPLYLTTNPSPSTPSHLLSAVPYKNYLTMFLVSLSMASLAESARASHHMPLRSHSATSAVPSARLSTPANMAA